MADLVIQAGKRAMAHVREHGLSPHDISIVPGAAGGPKGLGLAKLDEWLFADWLPQSFSTRAQPIDLIGSSIGAWRFASVCCGNQNGIVTADATRAALNEFAENYISQRYAKKITAAEVTTAVKKSVDDLFTSRIDDILTHPHYRLNVLAVRGKGILAREQRGRTQLGYALASAANATGRNQLRHFLERIWFYAQTQESTGSFRHKCLESAANRRVSSTKTAQAFDAFHTEYTALTRANLSDALVASGAIPMIINAVKHIHGVSGHSQQDAAEERAYWDGGIIDYHLHLPYAAREGLVLYPHFTDKIVPGWLDKMLPWRKARGAWLDNVILVSPSREYLDKLPLKKLPDRSDFKRFADDYDKRDVYWRFAIGESARLRDELAGLIADGKLGERMVGLK
jgi:hypothetical protein